MGRALVVFLAVAVGSAHAQELETDQYLSIRSEDNDRLPARGPDDALVTIEVSFAPGHTSAAASAEQVRRYFEREAARGDTSTVREIIRLLPLRNHPESDATSEAICEAARQGKLWAFVDRLGQERIPPTTQIELQRVARDAGMDVAQLSDAWASERHDATVLDLQERALDEGRSPAEVLVNGRRISSWLNAEGFDAAVKAGQKRAERLLNEGVPRPEIFGRLRAVEMAALAAERGRNRTPVAIDVRAGIVRGYGFAPMTIAFFGNLSTPVGSDWASWLRRIEQRHPGAIRVAFFPIAILRGGSDERLVALCFAAAERGIFWRFYDAVFSRPSLRRGQGEIEAIAMRLGLDVASIYERFAEGGFAPAIEAARNEMRRASVSSPSLALNGVPYTGMLSLERLAATVQRELDRGVLERRR